MNLISTVLNRTLHSGNIVNTFKGLTGGKVIYHKLLQHKVNDVFIYSGGSVMPLIDTFYQSKIKYYVNSHEQNCGHAATGYAKSTGKTGVAIVTSGPGITNIVTPILDATNDSTPLIVLSGQVNKSAIGTDAFQEAPSTEITKSATKWSYCVQDVNELPEVMDTAFKIANDRKKGAVHIDLPKCVSSGIFEDSTPIKYPPKTKTIKHMDVYYIQDLAKIINNSKKPILYIGQGCIDSYKLLREFAIKGNIPVTSTIHGTGIFDETHDLSLRWCGMHGSAFSNYSLQEADCIIALGSRFDDRTTGLVSKYAPKAMEAGKNKTGGIIHVDIEPRQINKVVETQHGIEGRCQDFLTYILPYIKHNPRYNWFSFINEMKNKYPFQYAESETLQMPEVLKEFNIQTQDKDVIFTTGVGNHQMQAYQYILSQYPRKILSSGSLGVMGAGLPYAVGAQIANPEKLVIDIDGDSSFNMTMSDLKTIKEHNLPVKIAVMNNHAQMMVTIWERLFFNERYTATINKNNPNYVKLAESFGIDSMYCDSKEDLSNCINKFINHPNSILCEFKVDRDICLPLVGPGKALDDMILFQDYQFDSKVEMDGMAPS